MSLSPSRWEDSPEPPEEIQRLRAELNLEHVSVSPKNKQPNPFLPPVNKVSNSSRSTPSRTFDQYISIPDSPQPAPPQQQGPSSSKKRRRRSPSLVQIFDHISPPPLEPSPPRVKRRESTTSSAVAKAATPVEPIVQRMREALMSPPRQLSGSSQDSSRVGTPTVGVIGTNAGVAALASSSLLSGPAVAQAAFRPDCRPLRSWGAVPTDCVVAKARSRAQPSPPMSVDTGMEWLYEIVGLDMEADEGSDYGSLSPAPSSSALPSTGARRSDRGPSIEAPHRPSQSPRSQHGAFPFTLDSNLAHASAEGLELLSASVAEQDVWMRSLQRAMIQDRRPENEHGHEQDEPTAGSSHTSSIEQAIPDDGPKMRSPDSGETREEEGISSEGDDGHRLSPDDHVCSSSSALAEAERRIASLERRLREESARNDTLQIDVHSSLENHQLVLSKIETTQALIREQAAATKEANQYNDHLSNDKRTLSAELAALAGIKKVKADVEAENRALARINKDQETSIVDLLFRVQTAELALRDPDLPNATPLVLEPQFIDLRPDLERRDPRTKQELVNAHLRTYLTQLRAENMAIKARLDARLEDDEQRQIEILEGRLLEKMPALREVRERRELDAARIELGHLRTQNVQLKDEVAAAIASKAKNEADLAHIRSFLSGNR